jgi:hypothetical protein
MTIIVIAKFTDSVFKDGNSILNLNLPIPDGVVNLYWYGTSGWIDTNVRTDITELPEWANQCVAIYEAALPVPPTPPTPTEQCYNTACNLLTETDWTQIPNSTLLNVAEFATYREQVRQYALNPVSDPVWPTKPTEQWQ